MSVYSISVFLHVVGALGLFSTLALEWAGHEQLRRVGGPSALLVLATGIYMTSTRWGPRPWIVIGLAAMVVIAILGPALSRRAGLAALSLRLRTWLFLGIVFLMTTEPGLTGSLVAIGVAALIGVVTALPARNPARMAESER
jgi:hypothetical protein